MISVGLVKMSQKQKWSEVRGEPQAEEGARIACILWREPAQVFQEQPRGHRDSTKWRQKGLESERGALGKDRIV